MLTAILSTGMQGSDRSRQMDGSWRESSVIVSASIAAKDRDQGCWNCLNTHRRRLRRSAMNANIRQALMQLTALRKRVLEANDTVGRLFASLSNDSSTPPSRDELDQAEKDLERQVPGFYVWFEP